LSTFYVYVRAKLKKQVVKENILKIDVLANGKLVAANWFKSQGVNVFS
jgi:hypothetical protein